MQFIKGCISIFLISVLFFSFSLKTTKITPEESGVFFCYINDKPFVVDSMTACIRKITGGGKQLSLNNERFVKFAFMNPSTKNIDLASSSVREAFIRYEDPASSASGIPVKGYINITSLDEENKVLSAEFEMEIKVENSPKTLKITHGRLTNIPIVFK
jgi:hypothetical protein